jgi:hypothetical protein
MRDMQGRYSYYLNQKYRNRPWLFVAPLGNRRKRRGSYSRYQRTGPVNWSPRFDAEPLDRAGFVAFLRYVENNSVRAKLAKSAAEWTWSSAAAHFAGSDADGLLCLEQWVDLFGRPDLGSAAEAWREFVEGPIEEERENARRVTAARRTGSSWNRPAGWVELTRSRTLAVAAGESPPGVG